VDSAVGFTNSIHNTYSIFSESHHFFSYQDFYLDAPSSNEDDQSDFEIITSIHQKFIDKNLVNFVIEILEEGNEFEDVK
jgi:hypothetical protein